MGFGFRVWGLGYRVWGLGLLVRAARDPDMLQRALHPPPPPPKPQKLHPNRTLTPPKNVAGAQDTEGA